ncbi:MAG: hypothetical protein KKC99_01025 [Proteobacteria bacterium]|nr:hypothetical protein [Pseudomonadota bacterium]
MQITIESSDTPLTGLRAYALTITIKSFKGRRGVDVHLFRPQWDPEEEEIYDWNMLIGDPMPGAPGDADSTRRMIMESFTEEERDRIVEFLKEQYSGRLDAITARPMEFPVPLGLPALSDMSEGKDIGFIRFDRIPSYSLDIPLSGLYDLARHEPLVDQDD